MQKIKDPSLITVLCEKNDDSIIIINPADDSPLGYIPALSKQQIQKVIGKSATAQKKWAKTTASHRAEILNRWYQLILDNQQDLARLMTLEQGKPLYESKEEVLYGASFIQWFAEEAKRTYGEMIPSPSANKRISTIKQPVGVAVAITPWNFPIAMITRKAAPALAAGCSFIVKPANQTPLCAYAIAVLALRAGLPKDLLQVVNSHSSVMVGKLFCEHPLINKISFTGSTETGRVLLRQSAETIKRTSMELGGNAPFIVFDDADIDAAVQGAIESKFRNAGQTCVCPNRFYVHHKIHDQFVDKFSQAMQALKIGNGLDKNVQIGPLIDAKAKRSVLRLLSRAKQQGAIVYSGGNDLGKLYVEPTLLTQVTQDMEIIGKEIFGPIAPVIKFYDDQELITMANDTIHGLTSYFYSRDIRRVFHIAEALDYGMVGVNEGIISTEVAPFGGIKQSGSGREGAKQGIDEYMNTKYICFGGLKS